MFCSKCHTEIRDEDVKFCPRCGQKIENKRTSNRFYFGSTFKTSLNEHEDQYNYSKDYSDVEKDENDTHQEQYNYSKDYSEVKKDTSDEHSTQYNYSKKFSDVKKDSPNEHSTQYSYSSKYSEINTDTITSDEDYIKAYVKNNYYSIKNKKFNIGALIFGPFYCLYRKVYPLGLIVLFFEVCFLFTIGGDYATLIELFINLFLAFKFNEIYLKRVATIVETIKNNNPDKTSRELIKICSNKGGTLSIKSFVALIIILPTIISILDVIFEYNEYVENNTKANNKYTVRDITYNIPNNFNEINSSDLHTYLKTSDNECYLNAFSITYSGDIKEYLSNNTNSTTYTYKSDINTYEHQGKKWEFINMRSSYGNKNIYVHEYNKYYYIFTFEGNCNEYINKIIYSVEYNKKSE